MIPQSDSSDPANEEEAAPESSTERSAPREGTYHASGELRQARISDFAKERVIGSIVRSDVPLVTESTALSVIPDLFARTRAPVAVLVDEDRKPLGAITPVDLFGAVSQHGPVSLAGVGMKDTAKATALYLRADTRLSSALRLFAEQRPDCILVVDEGGRLVGAVSATELLLYLTT